VGAEDAAELRLVRRRQSRGVVASSRLCLLHVCACAVIVSARLRNILHTSMSTCSTLSPTAGSSPMARPARSQHASHRTRRDAGTSAQVQHRSRRSHGTSAPSRFARLSADSPAYRLIARCCQHLRQSLSNPTSMASPPVAVCGIHHTAPATRVYTQLLRPLV